MVLRNRLTKEQALQKIKHYCSYQERCHREVKDKLYSFGLRKNEVEELVSQLIENNYLNEERFAIQFAGGKFRMKQWGRKKIQYELQQKGVNSFIIKIALKELEEKKYLETLQKLAAAKWKALQDENKLVRQSKTNAYLLQKGYEQGVISDVLKNLTASVSL
ncbi:regulatory protein RecX [Segetibacter koreensis]|uniref:regulatory protein RecX n=1 Tax=Segetibacter koreensis TaxID=398037 RepID=UPI000360C918|nr:regulatory protein RecX [Segetibacter koreensis]